MVSTISDTELIKQLKEFGENVGPITKTTREVWVRKLDRLKKEKKQRPSEISPAKGLNLSGFSSDDSEADLSNYKSGRTQRRRRTSSFLTKSEATKSNAFSPNCEQSSSVKNDFVFKKPDSLSITNLTRKVNSSDSGNYKGLTNLRPSTRRTLTRQSKHSLNTTFDVDTSDSDVDISIHNQTEKISPWRLASKVSDSHQNNTSLFSRLRASTLNRDESEETLSTSDNSTLLHDRSEDSYTDIYKGRQPGLLQNYQSLTDSGSSSIQANGYMSYSSNLNGEFRTEEDPGAATNYSQCISWLLLAVVGIFFFVIGMLYVNVRRGDPPGVLSTNYSVPLCNMIVNETCVQKVHLSKALSLTKQIHAHVSLAAGEYECNISKRPGRGLSKEELKFALKNDPSISKDEYNLELDLHNAILLISDNPDWDIRLHFLEARLPSPYSVRAFETKTANKPLFCRLREALFWTTVQVSIAILVVLGIYFLTKMVRKAKKKREFEQKEMYDMIEKIIGFLQQHHEACQTNSDLEQYVAILHVRDMLIPPSKRKSLQNVWNKAVAFLEENESRLRVEQQQVSGENFQVWRWLQCSPMEGGCTRQGKVWQGQAFGSSGKGMNILPFSPTPCLKIRNMFDPEVEYGDDWQVHIQDAILEKCEGNDGIVHIQVDTSTNEGCVYLKCNSPEAAGLAYRALHGWWFDGKLVTVKYLRPERYHERFPESRYFITSLKPSNNMRLSLSTPFHSSPLERS